MSLFKAIWCGASFWAVTGAVLALCGALCVLLVWAIARGLTLRRKHAHHVADMWQERKRQALWEARALPKGSVARRDRVRYALDCRREQRLWRAEAE